MFHKQPTKTSGTIGTYVRIGRTLLRRASKMEHKGEMISVTKISMRIALAFADAEPAVSAASARLYRAAAVYLIATLGAECLDDAMRIVNPTPSDDDYIREEQLKTSRDGRAKVLRGAQQKAKWVSETDWKTLLSALASSGNIWGPAAVMWLKAGMATGLRPCEWQSATLACDTLIVQNAKATNGRAPGKERKLCLAGATPAERQAVRDFLDLATECAAKNVFDEMYGGVRKLVWKTARSSLSPRSRYPSLYSARHVFCARAKAAHGHAWVAALMGHASHATAGRHYARAHHARGGVPLGVTPLLPKLPPSP